MDCPWKDTVNKDRSELERENEEEEEEGGKGVNTDVESIGGCDENESGGGMEENEIKIDLTILGDGRVNAGILRFH